MKSSSDSEGSDEFFDAEDSIPNRQAKYVVVVFAVLSYCVFPIANQQSLSPALRLFTITFTDLCNIGAINIYYSFYLFRKKSPKSLLEDRFEFPATAISRPIEDAELQRPLRIHQPTSSTQSHDFGETRSVCHR